MMTTIKKLGLAVAVSVVISGQASAAGVPVGDGGTWAGLAQNLQQLKEQYKTGTAKLKELENKILGANERLLVLEHQLFADLLSSIAAQILRLQRTASAVAQLVAKRTIVCVSSCFSQKPKSTFWARRAIVSLSRMQKTWLVGESKQSV